MKYYILLFVYISVASAFKVVDVNPETTTTTTSPPPPPSPRAASRKTTDFFSPFSYDEPLQVDQRPISSFFDIIPSISSVMRHVHDSMNKFFDGFTSPFRQFPSIFGSDSDLGTNSPANVSPIASLFNMGPPLGRSVSNNYPPNYSNSTSKKVHHSNNSDMVVNETVHKESGDGFSRFFSMKTFQVLPKARLDHNDQNKEKEEGEREGVKDDVQDELIANAEQIKKLPKSAERLNEIDFDDTDRKASKDDEDDFGFDSNGIKGEKVRRPKREIREQSPGGSSVGGNKAIVFPSSHLNRFPQSFLNNKNVRTEDLKERPISKSYVYKNIGGKTTMYIIDHNPKSKKGTPTAATNVAGVRPPDLSRDTKVNPSGNDDHQQSLVLVDPDAVVFDLNLVAKEIESRPKDK